MIKKVFNLLIALVVAANVNADKLDLLTANVRIGDLSAKANVYTIEINNDSITIDEIVVAKGNADKYILNIKEKGASGSLYNQEMQNNMTKDEMNGTKFTLITGKTYELSWNNKKWEIKLVKKETKVENFDLELLSETEIKIKGKSCRLDEKDSVFTINDTIIINSIKVSSMFGKGSLPITITTNGDVLFEGEIDKIPKNLNIQMDESHETVIQLDDKKIKIGGMYHAEAVSNIWIIILVVIICLVIVFLLYIKRKTRAEKLKKEQGYPETIAEKIIKANEKLLDTIMSNYKGKPEDKASYDEKLFFLTTLISNCYSLSAKAKPVIVPSKFRKKVINAILKPKDEAVPTVVTSSGDKPSSENSLINKIEKLISEKERIKKYYEEKCSGKDKFEDKIKTLFSILESALRMSEPVNEKSLQERLEHIKQDEMLVINKFVLKKIEDAGFVGIQSNTKLDTYLKEVVIKLNKVESLQSRDTDREIISDAVKNCSFTEEDKIILLHRVVDQLNNRIPDEEKKISEIKSFEQLYLTLSASLIVANSYEEAEKNGKEIVLTVISRVLGLEVHSADNDELQNLANQYFKNRLQKDVLSKLKNLDVEDDEDLSSVIESINSALKDSLDLSVLFNDLNVDYVNDIPNAIKKRDAENIKKALAGKSELPDDLELEACQSSEKIVNRLILAIKKADKAVKDKDDAERRITDELKDNFKNLTDEDMKETETLIGAFDVYSQRVNSIISEVAENLGIEKRINLQLGSTVKEQIEKLKEQEEDISAVTLSVVNNFNNGIYDLNETVKKGRFLKACDKDSKASCSENENRLISAMGAFKKTADSVSFNSKLPFEVFEMVQSMLSSELAKEDGVFNLISRYYTYSRLPFMTDKSREYGSLFDRSIMSNIYTVMDKLLSDFGFQLLLPTLFSERATEGEYEDCTGLAYSDLDNLCPNAVNYKEYITNADKREVIIDIIHVGYRKNGQVEMKTKVLI